MLTMPVDELAASEGTFLTHLLTIAPELARAGKLATSFAALIRNAPDKANGSALEAWLASAKGTLLDAFVRGVERDHGAVLAALTEPWSTGPVESQINRLKLLKRTMYGRAKYDLLRRRVLAAA
jgi:transposase